MMAQRKGQFIINYLRFDVKVPEKEIGRILFAMRDEQFERIEQKYRQYVIEELHKFDRQARHEDLQQIADNVKTVFDYESQGEKNTK